uniref:CCHC-type domain-containing protein n=1 Tax=Strigamia maritima TaxID=126957 RepID=T1JCM4_STRMM
MNEKLDTFKQRQVYVEVPKPMNQKILGTKWVYKIKTDSSDNIMKFRAHLVAQGFRQTSGLDYEEVYSPIEALSLLGVEFLQVEGRTLMSQSPYFAKHAEKYAARMRPDIAYSVIALSQYSGCHLVANVKSLLQVLQYMVNTSDYCIDLSAGKNDELWAYSDASWANCEETLLSFGGYVLFLGSVPILWQCRKQTKIATSTMEAECVTMVDCIKESYWVDASAAIQFTQNDVENSKTKHIRVKFHWLREWYIDKLFKLAKVTNFEMSKSYKTEDKVDKLDRSNWKSWIIDVLLMLEQHGLWGFADETDKQPAAGTPGADKEILKWKERGSAARAMVCRSVSQPYKPVAIQGKTCKEVLDRLRAVFQPKSRARRAQLRADFIMIRYESKEDMACFIVRVERAAEECKEAGLTISDEEKTYQLMYWLDGTWESLKQQLYGLEDDKFTFGNVGASLQAEFNRRYADPEFNSDISMLSDLKAFLASRSSSGKDKYSKFKPNMKPDGQANNSEASGSSLSNITCLNCQEHGHYANKCKNPHVKRGVAKIDRAKQQLHINDGLLTVYDQDVNNGLLLAKLDDGLYRLFGKDQNVSGYEMMGQTRNFDCEACNLGKSTRESYKSDGICIIPPQTETIRAGSDSDEDVTPTIAADFTTNVDGEAHYVTKKRIRAYCGKIKEPKTYEEAISSPQKELWLEAINEELGTLQKREVYEEVKSAKLRFSNRQPLGLQFEEECRGWGTRRRTANAFGQGDRTRLERNISVEVDPPASIWSPLLGERYPVTTEEENDFYDWKNNPERRHQIENFVNRKLFQSRGEAVTLFAETEEYMKYLSEVAPNQLIGWDPTTIKSLQYYHHQLRMAGLRPIPMKRHCHEEVRTFKRFKEVLWNMFGQDPRAP